MTDLQDAVEFEVEERGKHECEGHFGRSEEDHE